MTDDNGRSPPEGDGDQRELKETSGAGPPFCPSAQPEMEASVVLGVVGGTVEQPRVQYLREPQAVTDDILALSAPVRPTEVFRFAAPCQASACKHFDGSHCRLAQRVVERLPAVASELPFCRIRPACRWWREEGRAACLRCPQVATEVADPSLELRQVADPEAESGSAG